MRNSDLAKSFKKFCPKCEYFQQETGVCKKFYFNVRDYPGKFLKKCNGNYFKEDTTKIVQKIDEVEALDEVDNNAETVQTLRPDDPSTASNPLYGVSGWLKLFVVVNLYIAPVLFVLQHISAWIGFSVLAEDHPGIIFVGLVETVITGFLVYKAIQVARGLRDIKEGAVQNAKSLLKLVLAWRLLSIPFSYLSGLDAEALLPGNIKGFLTGVIGFAIWYSYFNVSQRVKATYPDWNA